MTSISFHLGSLQKPYQSLLANAKKEKLLSRIWDYDYTLWADSPEEITNRLGWLHAPTNMARNLEDLTFFVSQLRLQNYNDVILLGMGGSSLAPDVFMRIFGNAENHPQLTVLDSTDPDHIEKIKNRLDIKSTLFIVSTKSGGTVETLSLFKYFYNLAAERLGANEAGRHFIAITDPGSKLEDLAREHNFARTFLNDPNIGGRFSALTYFGLLPAALFGVDIQTILETSQKTIQECSTSTDPEISPAVQLGTAISTATIHGRDKLTLVASDTLAPFGDWLEQLIAESTGKSGKGVLPVVGEVPFEVESYSEDRIFVCLRLESEKPDDELLNKLKQKDRPVIEIVLSDIHEIGSLFILWEMATTVAGWGLQIHPFDQPNVEAAKESAREVMASYEISGNLPKGTTAELNKETVTEFLRPLDEGSYISIQAFVEPNLENEKILQDFRIKLRDTYKVATTLGFGPRFLHSTGQLHKGDGGNGFFIQITSLSKNPLAIPENTGSDTSMITFATLKHAQALGDASALRKFGRQILSFEIQPEDLSTFNSLI